MKLKNLFFTCLFAIVLISGQSIIAQTTHTITLNVNTGKITENTVNTYANFGQTDGVSNENFTTNVKLGDYVEWVGVSTSSEDDVVEIVSINHEGGARVFAKNVLVGSAGIVIAQVTDGKVGDYQKYTIKFRVYRNGTRLPGIFMIDPKIVIKG